jgi:hypothetical protein
MRAKKPLAFIDWYNDAARNSLQHFLRLAVPAARAKKKGSFRRNANVKGPMSAFGYDYFDAHFKGAKKPKLAEEHRYEALNLADGWRTTAEIRDMLNAIYGNVALADVEEYFAALESIGVVERVLTPVIPSRVDDEGSSALTAACHPESRRRRRIFRAAPGEVLRFAQDDTQLTPKSPAGTSPPVRDARAARGLRAPA